MMTRIGRLMALSCLLNAMTLGSLFAQTLSDENLLTPLPKDWKVAFHDRKGTMDLMEYVPISETVDTWSKMITVQIYHGQKSRDPDVFASLMKQAWVGSCTGGNAGRVRQQSEQGYPVSVWLFTCPTNPATQKPENMWMKAISGQDSFYTVQYAIRSELTKEAVTPPMTYLSQIVVCDTRMAERKCPAGM